MITGILTIIGGISLIMAFAWTIGHVYLYFRDLNLEIEDFKRSLSSLRNASERHEMSLSSHTCRLNDHASIIYTKNKVKFKK